MTTTDTTTTTATQPAPAPLDLSALAAEGNAEGMQGGAGRAFLRK